MTGEKDPRDVMQAEHDARLSEHPAFQAPAEMPGGEAARFAAAYLGFNPHDPSTWDADIVNRLVRIRSERGDQAFVQEVANLTTLPGAGIASPFNACCYREHCKALEARALAAEAALAAERERVEQLHATIRKAHVAMTMACALPGVAAEYDFSEAIASTEATLARRAAAIRAQGE